MIAKGTFTFLLVRFVQDKTASKYLSIYTDEVTDCWVVIVYGKHEGNNCFSVTHVDPSVTTKWIETEREWVGSDSKIIVAQHEYSKDTHLRQI